jgi:maltose O-acetyltransferase
LSKPSKEPTPQVNLIVRFFKEYSWKQAAIILIEPWIQAFLGWIPGFTGFLIRNVSYRIFLKQLRGMSFIAAGVTFQRSYGIRIGKNFAVNRGSFIDGKGGVQFGDNVLVGPYVVIASSGHSFDDPNMPILSQTEHKKAVTIGNDVWIGSHVVIMPGVKIGDRVIIGAGAVVTKDIESHCIAMGIPAKITRKI